MPAPHHASNPNRPLAIAVRTRPPAVLDALFRGPPVLFPSTYAWFVLVASLDLMVTNTVITYLNAREVNALAQTIIERFDWWGLITFKFTTVLIVLLICEYVGRRRLRTARAIARAAVAISAFPVLAAAAQLLLVYVFGVLDPIPAQDHERVRPFNDPFQRRLVLEDQASFRIVPRPAEMYGM